MDIVLRNSHIDVENKTNVGQIHYGWWIVLAGTIVLSAQGVMFYGFGILFPSILEEFNWSRALTSSILSVQIATSSMFMLLMGYLVERFSPRFLINIGVLFLSVGLVFSSFTREIWHLYLFFGIIVGAGTSATYLPPIAVVTRWFEKRRGLALGLTVAGIGVGGLVGSPFLNWLIQSFGWRTALIILGLSTGAVVFVAAIGFVGHPGDKRLEPYGAESSPEDDDPGSTRPTTDQTFPGENSRDGDWTVLQALKTRAFIILFVMLFFVEVSLLGVMAHLFTYATENGLPTNLVSWAYGTIAVASIIGKIGGGALSDHIGRKNAFLLSFTLMGTAFVFLLPIPNATLLFLFAVILGLSYGAWTPLFPAIVSDFYGPASMGKIYSILAINFFLGGASGPVLAGRIFDRTGSYLTAFIIFAVICYLSAVSLLFLRNPNKTT